MATITENDREAAASAAVLVEMRDLIRAGRADHHAEPFARHREAAELCGAELMRVVVLRALRGVQHSPAPYTDAVKAIRAIDAAKACGHATPPPETRG